MFALVIKKDLQTTSIEENANQRSMTHDFLTGLGNQRELDCDRNRFGTILTRWGLLI